MKFKDTYSLLKFLMENDNLSFSIHENKGFPFLKIIGNLDEALEKHLEERITNLLLIERLEITINGTGSFEKNKEGELLFSFDELNKAFPSHDFASSENNRIFVYGLLSCLYSCLRKNDMLNNQPEDDFEYEAEFESIPIDVNFEICDGKIIDHQVKVLNTEEIKELNDHDKIKIITSLYDFIKNDGSGECDFSYSEGYNMKVGFDAFCQQIDIYDFGKTELYLKDYLLDGVEYELN